MILALVVVAGPLAALAVGLENRRRLAALQERLDRLERGAGPAPTLGETPVATAAPPSPPAPATTPTAATPAPTPAPSAAAPARTFEQIVGGLWLQSAGSVLVLLGAFFLILWGYTNGRFGPGVLVAAGVALGLALIWRGDRSARRLPAFGHALIGIGLGVIYVALYLGHYTLGVLDARIAFTLLALVSLSSVAIGLARRSETVAVLGVIGAFLPRLLAAWLPLRGFALAPGPLLGYLAVVDAAVFVLAARPPDRGSDTRGRLDLAALGLTTLTWLLAFPEGHRSWGVQIGLSALYAGLGLAVVPRLARATDRVPTAVLATLAAAPPLYLVASWPFLAWASATTGALMLLAMTLLWLLAAAWVESRGGRGPAAGAESAAWRALAAAAVLFLTTALGRALGPERTAAAWCAEALALVALGLRGRGWLRGYGYAVGVLGALWVAVRLATDGGWHNGLLPVLNPDGLRNLGALLFLVALAALLGRVRGRFGAAERLFADLWIVGTNLLVVLWSAVESGHLAQSLHGSGGRWARPPSITDLPVGRRIVILAAVLTSVAWLVQAAVLLALGWRRRRAFLRWLGLALFGVTVAKFLLFDLATVDVFWRFLIALLVGAALLGVSYLYQRRARPREAPPTVA